MTASLDELKTDRSGNGRTWVARIVWLVVILAVAGAGGTAGWRWWEEARIPVVRTAAVRQTVLADGQPTVLNASGYVTARLQSTVSSKVTGRIVEVLVEEGMAVTEGQVLARLDDTTERSYLALAARRRARRPGRAGGALRRGPARPRPPAPAPGPALDWTGEPRRGAGRGRLAPGPHCDQREQVVVAKREIDVRRTAAEATAIRAPFSGVAISKDAQPGEMISPVSAGGGFTRTGVCTIVDMSSLENALRSDGETQLVFVVRGDTVERRAVTTGLVDGGDVEVLAGVSVGERVVVEGSPALADGDRVVTD